jgi:hypothetical protein
VQKKDPLHTLILYIKNPQLELNQFVLANTEGALTSRLDGVIA